MIKKYLNSVVFWCWAWYVLAHVADTITSLRRWGCYELNPAFRDEAHRFIVSHALLGKSVLTVILASASYLAYRLVVPLDKRLAAILACFAPLYYGLSIWRVVNSNLFVIMHWIS